MKKILVLSFYYYPDLCAGSFRCTSLVEELAKTKASIHVITTVPNRYESFKVSAVKYSKTNNVVIDRIEIPSHNSGMIDQIKSFYAFYRGARRITAANDYDLVFATSSRLFTAFLGARVSRKKRIPLYLDVRDLFVDTMSNILSPALVWLASPVLSVIERYTFNSAKKINMVSKGFLPYFEQRYSDIPISFFTNGIDKEFIQASHVDDKTLATKSTINILYAGNVGEGQGLHKIIPEMADRLNKRINFKVIGGGGLIQKLRDAVAELGLNNVELVPPMGREALIKEYIKADVLFLHLNDYEAFRKVLPSKLFEYGAMNKPILAGISGYSEEFVKSEISDCAVFSPTDSEDAVRKFESLSYSIKPREEFIKKFDRQKIMREMAEDIYGTG
ncbi:glycosyl transferase, group 1; possible capsular polysaccharide biosynthesis protein [marine gamma proteobacterium HTCC2207]|uniref:Glycosyl transferase, group 1 possible capsular polysaccharide biosynthesis protein n=1 Tax=gamma proteobacterium HTCC2207 TaxID=314287 RepID=Q1YPR3_9GAMM|nr:glycosyl transferase, group 1; possible capsular polysaccharide biosynthesis protein [marine gamma proteobacterium HTCC2207] [gamma proteobacterium HTCC2207]